MLVDLSVPEEGSAMTYRNIVVHIDETAAARTRASIAAGLAVKFGATLTGMFMRSDYVPAFIAGDAFSAVTALEAYVEQRDRTIAKSSAAARAAFEAETSPHKISTDWVEVNGDDDDNVLAAVRRYDLTVFPHVATSSLNTYAVSAAHIGMGSGAPVLVLPERGFQIPFGKRVLVAWKETREAARALRDAWPFLMAADEVHFLAVSRNAPDGFDDAMRRNLEAHGCTNIHMHVDRNDDIDVANAIQRHSGRVGADLVVLGLYGHSRMREMLLGGVSRDMLDALHLPLLVSH
jgi:nucleotide-binding universal stress UspA family protein